MSNLISPPQFYKKKIKLGVMLLTNKADVFQALIALKTALSKFPELEITLILNDLEKEEFPVVSWIHEILFFPVRDLLASTTDAQMRVPKLALWVEKSVSEPFDILINWSFTESSSFLCSLLPAQQKIGYHQDLSHGLKAEDGWSQYIRAIVQSSQVQEIHLTDLMTTQLLTVLQVAYGEPKVQAAAVVPSRNFLSQSSEAAKSQISIKSTKRNSKWVALKVSSEESFSTKKWSKVLAQILRRHDHTSILLFGSESETARTSLLIDELLADFVDVESIRARILCAVGKLSSNEQLQALGECDWLLSDCSESIALASLLGVRTIAFYDQDQLKWKETAPYGYGHFVVYSRQQVSSDQIAALYSYAHSEWYHQEALKIEEHFKNFEVKMGEIQIYKSRMRSVDEGGGVTYEPLVTQKMRMLDWLSLFYSRLARNWYCGWAPHYATFSEVESLSDQLIKDINKLLEGKAVYLQMIQQSKLLTQKLAEELSQSKKLRVISFNQSSKQEFYLGQLSDIDKLAFRVIQLEPSLEGIYRLQKVMLDDLRGKNLNEIIEKTLHIYDLMEDCLEELESWIHYTLDQSKLKKAVLPQFAQVIPIHRTTDLTQ